MKIILDTSLCTGHGRCYSLAPEVFDEDEQGHCVLKRESPAPALHDAARSAVAACPERALRLGEEPGPTGSKP